jgi:hypothetical protein
MKIKPRGTFGSKHYEKLRMLKPHYPVTKTQKTTHIQLLCNYLLHHKLIGFIGSFQIHAKLVVSGVCVFCTWISCLKNTYDACINKMEYFHVDYNGVLHSSWKWVVLIILQLSCMNCTIYTLSWNFAIHVTCPLALMTYKYNELQLSL